MKKPDLSIQRRSFLRKLAAGTAGSVLLPGVIAASGSTRPANPAAAAGPAAPYPSPHHVKLGISSYSYWHFADERTPIQYVIEEASRLGVNGVDILHRQMEGEDARYIRELKRHALIHGVDLNCLSSHSDYVTPDREERQSSIEDTKGYIRLAHDLGIPCIRLSAGRWNTSGSFSELMDNRGIEPPIEGYTEEDALEWCVDALEQCIPVAEEHGVVLGLENHWGISRTAENILHLVHAIDSPWLRVLLDTGNFFERRYEQIEMLAPYTVFVQAKTYYGGGIYYDLDIDYDRIARILGDADYKGYISIEFEGEDPSEEAVERSIEMLRTKFAG